MKIRKKIKKFFYEKGFTLLEILIVIAIMAIISSIIVPQIIQAKEKAYNANVKQVLQSLRPGSLLQYFEATPNSYSNICGTGPVDLALDTLGSQNGVTSFDYQCTATADKWTAVFPFKGGGYWCTDSEGASIAVVGFLANPPTVIDCAHATVVPGSIVTPPPPPPANTIPSITLVGTSPQHFYTTSGNPFSGNGNGSNKWCDPGFTATDAEDGTITPSVVVTGPTLISSTSGSCKTYTYEMYYNVTDSAGANATTKTRTLIHHKCNGTPAAC